MMVLFQGMDADIAYFVVLVLVAVWSAVLPFVRDVLAEVWYCLFAVVCAFLVLKFRFENSV